MQKIDIQAQSRSVVGRKCDSLRKNGIIPSVLYGDKFDPKNIQVFAKDFKKVFSEAGESTLVYLKLDGSEYPTIIHDTSIDPVSGDVIHADFYKVNLDKKITADIPVVIVGVSPAVKNFGGILVKNVNEIEVEGFPQDLPHEFKVDISKLENIDDQIMVKDIDVPANIEIKAKPEEIIALIQAPISEEELKKSLEASTTTTEDVEVIKKEKKEEETAEETEAAPATEGKSEK